MINIPINRSRCANKISHLTFRQQGPEWTNQRIKTQKNSNKQCGPINLHPRARLNGFKTFLTPSKKPGQILKLFLESIKTSQFKPQYLKNDQLSYCAMTFVYFEAHTRTLFQTQSKGFWSKVLQAQLGK